MHLEDERDKDLRAAVIAVLFANANRDTERRPQPYTAADFFPRLAMEESEEDAGSDWDYMAALVVGLGGTVITGGDA